MRGMAGGRLTSWRMSSFLTKFDIFGQGRCGGRDLTRAENACWGLPPSGEQSGGAMGAEEGQESTQ